MKFISNLFLIFSAILIIAIIGLIFAGIIANELNEIDSGVIVDKYMDNGGTYYSSSKDGGYLRSSPPSYSFTIRGEKDGKIVEYSFEVSESEYNSYKIGDDYQR